MISRRDYLKLALGAGIALALHPRRLLALPGPAMRARMTAHVESL